MANPRGQQRDKPFRDALRMEIAAAQDDDDFRSLRKIAQNLLKAASKGKIDAIREIADRLDGKPVQAVEVGEPGDFEALSDEQLADEVLKEAEELGVPVGETAH